MTIDRFNNIKKMKKGFTLLEIIIVLFLITLIAGLSSTHYANLLPAVKFNAVTREMMSTIKHARNLAKANNETTILTIDLDNKKYNIEGLAVKEIPKDVNVKIVDPDRGELFKGKYLMYFYAGGVADGGTVVMWNHKRKRSIQLDPILGAIIANTDTMICSFDSIRG
ncbi:MAG: hypothetical protein CVU61_02690 [Deltaproteobacteria bacterium HGW-Deltaproteobacteria-19]|jgi:general secretion pathway protein H|nr:MAG: hypothetical protein CVU61_02690 [Deltaproteobacteria bacterium HGW-Deltaproteobacteria-19]